MSYKNCNAITYGGCNQPHNGGRSEYSGKSNTQTWHDAVRFSMPRPNFHSLARVKKGILFLTISCLVLLAFSSLFPAPKALAAGTVYYVSTTGSDSNPGTATSPFKTIAKGFSALKAGYTLYIKSGKYVLTSPVKISASGTATAPIVVSTAPGEPSKAILTGDTNGDGKAEVPSQGSWTGLITVNGSYVTIQNLEVTYSGGRGITTSGSNVTVSGNTIHHIWRSGVNVFGAYNIIEKNTLYRTVDLNWCGGKTGRLCNGNWDGGLAWGDPRTSTAPGMGSHATIRNNIVYNTSGEGLLCMHNDYATIVGNVVYDNWAVDVDLDQCSYATVQNNLIYHTSDKVWWRRTDRAPTGLMLSNEGILDSAGKTYPIGHDRKVINNIIVGPGLDIYFWTGDGGLKTSALVNDLIAYNTLVNPQGTGSYTLKIDAGPHSNTRIINNIFLSNTGLVYAGSKGGISLDHNLWSKTPPSGYQSSTDVVGNPLLADPNHTVTAGATIADWYKTSPSSPAVDRALSLTGITLDFWNDARSTMPDIGADEAKP